MVLRLASATFFRSIGGSFGVAIFGAIFSNVRSAAAQWSVCRLS